MNSIVVSMTKMGNIVPRAGFEPAAMTLRANVLPLHNVDSLLSTLYLRISLPQRSVQTTIPIPMSLQLHTYRQWPYIYIHIQGRFNNHTACSFYRIMVMATIVVGVTKMGNIVPRV